MKHKSSEPDSPAIIREGHTQSNVIDVAAGVAAGWRNDGQYPLALAEHREQIDGWEFAAGELYRKFYKMMGRGTADSLELVFINGRSTTPFTEVQVNAIRIIQAIETELQKLDTDRSNWVVIIRKFCGEDYTGREAVVAAGEKNPRFTRQRIKLALSKLSTAISRTRIDFRTGGE